MYYETMERIHKVANERFELYRLAGKKALSPEQRRRLGELDAQLPVLWDEHRREVAAKRYGQRQPAPVEAIKAA